jgi:hypothetical protein
MMISSRSAPLATLWMCISVAPLAAQPVCRPAVAITRAQFSEVVQQKRFWTAMVNVDASRCATTSGDFSIGFVRLSETAPDLEFTESFNWRPGPMQVVVDFAAEEAVHQYLINTISPCRCHDE